MIPRRIMLNASTVVLLGRVFSVKGTSFSGSMRVICGGTESGIFLGMKSLHVEDLQRRLLFPHTHGTTVDFECRIVAQLN